MSPGYVVDCSFFCAMAEHEIEASLSQQCDLERCDREIQEIRERAAREEMPAYLVTMGIHDWQTERRLIETEEANAL